MKERGWGRAVLGAGVVVALAAAAAGCGGGSSKSSSGGGTTGTSTAASSGGGKTFANFTATWAPPDYMDPSLAYTTQSWQVMWNVWIGLLTYKHVAGSDGATLIPGLADAMPQVSNGGKTYKF